MTNAEKIKQVFLRGVVKEATNSELSKLTGIQPHSQVYQITNKLVSQGFLKYALKGKEKVFYLSQDDSNGAGNAKAAQLNKEYVNGSPQSLEIIKKLGFELVGKWFRDDTGKLKHDIKVVILTKRPALYAFVIEGQVMYVGKTTTPLGKRLYGYINPGPRQSTNQKNRENICESISKSRDVEIWVFSTPRDELVFRGMPINLPAGLEDAIIESLTPEWNQTGK